MFRFFGEFAPSGEQRRFIGANQTFRDAPGSVILVLPKWSTWMTEQDFEISGVSSKQEKPRACGLREAIVRARPNSAVAWTPTS
jgi:hypothetical protein